MAKRMRDARDQPEGRAEGNGKQVATMESQPARPAKRTVGAASVIVIPELDFRELRVEIVGTTELICHQFGAKARGEILDRQRGKAKAGRKKKEPVDDFLATLYTLEEGEVVGDFDDRDPENHPRVFIKGGRFGYPASAFKKAAVDACTSTGKAITKVMTTQAFYTLGELVEIRGQPRMREDMVRLQGKTPDVRHRAGFPEWSCALDICYNACVLSPAQIVTMLNLAGRAVGVGEWRSAKGGNKGAFRCK